MPRDQRFAPRRDESIIADATVRRALAAFQSTQGTALPHGAPSPVVTQPTETPDGIIETRHVAFYDIDEYDDPNAVYAEGMPL